MPGTANTQPSIFILDNFVATKPGEPYRLFPFGTIIKGGVSHEITPEYAAKFKLPHFKPAIKLGSHDEVTPAGGHLIGLEVRADGLWGFPEMNEKGEQALLDGAYRYHSPEVIWDGYFEDPTNGAPIEGPLIVGDALLHNPHLGEAAALYHFEPQSQKELNEMNETVEVPKTFWDKLESLFAKPQPEPVETTPDPVEPAIKVEEFTAAVKERDEFKAKLETIEAEAKQRETVTSLVAELQKKSEDGKAEFGSMYIEAKNAEEAATILAGMSPEQREWVMRNFKASAAQIDQTKLTAELGTEGNTGALSDPIDAFDAAIRAKSMEKKLDYTAALRAVVAEQPALYESYIKAKK